MTDVQNKTAPSTRAGKVNTELLAIYLNDHLTAATANVALARRLAASKSPSGMRAEVASLVEHIEQDRRSMLDMMKRLGIAPKPLKNVLGVVAERVGRLKLNGTLIRRSPLSTVIELEGLEIGIEAKVACWRTLHRLADHDARIDPSNVENLITRAGEQFTAVERLRRQAVEAALT